VKATFISRTQISCSLPRR